MAPDDPGALTRKANAKINATSIRTTTLARLALSLVMALLLGSMVAQSADATSRHTVSKSDSIRSQRELCEGGGGTFTEKTLLSGSTKTSSKGGANDGSTCVNSDEVADCQTGPGMPAPEVSVPGEISVSPTHGVYEEPANSVQDEVSAPRGGIDGTGGND